MLHYGPDAAITQKVGALRGRSTTEPRDVFDLDHLIRQFPTARAAATLGRDALLAAATIAEGIPYERYQELVEPYLDETIVSLYSGDQAWLEMQTRVTEALRRRAG